MYPKKVHFSYTHNSALTTMIANRVLMLFLITGLITACTPDSEDWFPESSDVLFTSNRSSNSEIYIKTAEDTAWINLSNHESGDNWPMWSPDGQKILFQSRRSGNLDIWIMNNDGSNQVQLTNNPAHDYLASFTPDGEKISFTSWRSELEGENQTPHLYIMNADGSGQKRLIESPLNTSAGAAWHPGGEKFLITRKTDNPGADIYEVSKEGAVLRRITNDTLYSSSGTYSPSGSDILFSRDYGDSTSVYIRKKDGREIRLLAGAQYYYPRFSPDGKWIIYTKVIPESENSNMDIYTVKVGEPDNEIPLVIGLARESEGVWMWK